MSHRISKVWRVNAGRPQFKSSSVEQIRQALLDCLPADAVSIVIRFLAEMLWSERAELLHETIHLASLIDKIACDVLSHPIPGVVDRARAVYDVTYKGHMPHVYVLRRIDEGNAFTGTMVSYPNAHYYIR